MVRIIFDSQIYNSFLSCEQHFNLRFNHNLVPIAGMGKAIEQGSMMHDILESYYGAARAGANKKESFIKGMQTGNLFIRGCENCVKKICIEHKDNRFRGLQTIDIDVAHYVLQTFDQYHNFWINDPWTSLEVEHVMGSVIYEDDEISVLWKAKLDWLVDTDSGIFSVDHKTASRREDVLSLDNQFIGQTVLTKQTRMYRNVIGFQTSLKPNEKFTREPVGYTKERQAEWILEVASYAYDFIAMQEGQRYRHKFTSCRRRYGDCIFRDVCVGQPSDRQRLLEKQFKVSDKIWDIQND